MFRVVLLACAVVLAASTPVVPGPDWKHMVGDSLFPFEFDGTDRNSVKEVQRWPDGRIPYVISDDLKEHEKLIKDVMDYIAEKTCIKYEPKTANDKTYADIINGPMCMGYIGTSSIYTNMTVSLNIEQCMNFGVILHELTHVIGFYHEHQRLDRDEYIDIHWENIQEEAVPQFNKVDPKWTTTFNDFEYDSIMMYGELTFSKDEYGGLKTMTPKKKGVVLKGTDQKKYTDSDIYRIKKMYNC